MENNQNKIPVKNFFLELSIQVAFYTIIINLGVLFFRVINHAYPLYSTYYSYSEGISLPVAILIVMFPIFIALNFLLNKDYGLNPLLKENWVRKWLIYLTLFISGIIFSGSLVSVLYKFLDGQDLTVSFLLKFLTIFILSLTTFSYYLADIKNKTNNKTKKNSAIIFLIIIISSIVLGFSVIGSPKTQRILNYDDKKISDLIAINQQIILFYQTNSRLPENINQTSENDYFQTPKDTQNNTDYVYAQKSQLEYRLCANFNLDSRDNRDKSYVYDENNNWNYKKGEYCFERKIPDYIINSPKIIKN